MNIPSHKECEALMQEYALPENVRRHMRKVNMVAVFVAQKLKEAGVDIDVDLVDRASLLHDLMRVCDFSSFKSNPNYDRPELTEEELAIWEKIREKYGNMHHEDATCEELKDKYPEVAQVISKHKYALVGDKKEGPNTWEEKVVNYADKRVAHDKIVSLDERRKDALERYKDHEFVKVIDKEKELRELEEDIFSKLSITPKDVQGLEDG